jgi:hypothetical protein
MGTSVTIHGGQGSDTINFAFTVTGTNTTFYTTQFETAVNTILGTTSLGGGSITPDLATNYGGDSAAYQLAADLTTVYVLEAPATVAGQANPIPDYTVGAGAFALDTISGAANVTIAGADTVLVAAINAEAAITGEGGDNRIIFVTGQNVFDGSADTGGDTVVAGSGQDTIYTSLAGSTTVFSGTGEAKIVLQDTTPASTTAGAGINDIVYLQDGANTVYASGAWDAVIATQENQTIYGFTSDAGTVSAGSILVAVLQPNSDGTGSGNDLVNGAGTDSVFVFDNSSGNTIEGGAGNLNFLGGDSVSASIGLGTGNAFVFASAGDNLTFSSETATGGNGILVAGDGSETLNGAAATNTLYITGDSTATAANDLFVGGAGTNYLTAGTGNETLQGGTGTNYFQINESASGAASLTISDFSASGSSTLFLDGGYTQADVQAIYNSTNDQNGNLVVTIGNSTTVTFTGITSGSQLVGHVVLFQ